MNQIQPPAVRKFGEAEEVAEHERFPSNGGLGAQEPIEDAELISDYDVEGNLREVNLGSPEGLGVFLGAAEDIYADAAEYEAEAMAEGFERLKKVDLGDDDPYEAFSGLYEKLGDIQELVDQMRYEYIPAEKEVPDETVNQLQELYNEMVFRRDAILSAYASETQAVEGGVEESGDDLFQVAASPRWESASEPNLEEHRRQVKEELVEFLKSKNYKGIAKRLRRSVDVADTTAELNRIRHNIMNSKEWDESVQVAEEASEPIAPEVLDEAEKVPAEVPEIVEESPSGVSKERFEKASQVVNAVVTLAEATQLELQSALPAEPSPAANAGLNALEAEIGRGKDMLLKIAELSDSSEEASVIENTLERYQRIATTKLQQNINGLADLVRKELGIQTKTETVEVTEDAVDQAETPQEAAERERTVADLLDGVRSNQFLANQERETVKAMYEELQRRVKTLRPKAELDQAVGNLQSFITGLSEHPAVEVLQERAQRILERIEPAKTGNPDMYMSAQSLKSIIDRITNDPEGSKTEGAEEKSKDDRLVSAYLNLERHARDHESDWLSVCGMVVPNAGPDGVYGARSFREGLLLARDTHPELVRSPERQQMVDKIIRILARVPASGITPDEEKEIRKLARMIDTPMRVVEARQREKAEGVREPEPEIPMPVNRRKVMDVQSSPEDDGDIEIRVAAGAVDEIIQEEVETESEDPAEAVEELAVEPDGKGVIEAVEERDVINHVLPANVPEIPEAEPVDADSLTRRYLTDSRYTGFIDEYFKSPEGFDRVLMTEVKRIEEQTRDSFEKWLGEEYASPFHTLLKDLSLDEVNELQSRTHAELKEEFKQQNIKYETFVTWIDLYAQMREEVGENGHMTFGELFARWIIEAEMTYYGENTSPSQFTL